MRLYYFTDQRYAVENIRKNALKFPFLMKWMICLKCRRLTFQKENKKSLAAMFSKLRGEAGIYFIYKNVGSSNYVGSLCKWP